MEREVRIELTIFGFAIQRLTSLAILAWFFGGLGEDRTRDLLRARQVLHPN